LFVCPTCGKEFVKEELVQKHFLACWQEQHPYHKSKDAPRSKDIEIREVNNDIADFFERLNKI
jgi:hypothetical protein